MTLAVATPMLELQGACPLPHLGLIRCLGEEAAHFLHNQLTQDVLLLPHGQSRLAAFCNAQGRMQASMVVHKRSADEIWLIMRRDLLPRTLRRLSMFILRAKVRLSDASTEQSIWGLSGEVLHALNDQAVQPWQTLDLPQGVVIGLYPIGDQARALLLPRTEIPFGPSMAHADWLAGEILAGVADISESTFEAFIPQMLNFESVDGVNFKKGCYPGQEVVARSQFRGTLKRRAFIAYCDAPVQAGSEVMAGGESCGLVAQAATLPSGTGVALVCLMLSHAQRSDLTVSGLTLHLLPLPYPLRQDI